jgi:4-amino-4-deoxy-L-arabinose transferase-like glycosyltransferase
LSQESLVGRAQLGRQRQTPTDFFALLCLALPFALVVLWLRALTLPFPTFHGGDEQTYHLPVVREFIRDLPSLNLRSYHSPTTPLAYVIFALVGRLISDSVAALRLTNTLASLAASFVLFRFYAGRSDRSRSASLLMALCVSLSPYFFGTSFLVMTDNIALFCMATCLLFAGEFLERENSRSFLLASATASLAVLARQLYVWLVPMLGIAVIAGAASRPRGRTAGYLALLALALAPYAALCWLWGGAVPPEFRRHEGLNFGATSLSLATLGAYSSPFLAIQAISNPGWRGLLLSWRSLICAGIATVVLFAGPLHYTRGDTEIFPTDGYLWRIGQHFPDTSLGSLALVALAVGGVLALAFAWTTGGPSARAAVPLFACFALAHVLQASLYQKYFDVVALIVALLCFGSGALPSHHWMRAVIGTYCLAFVAYALVRPG